MEKLSVQASGRKNQMISLAFDVVRCFFGLGGPESFDLDPPKRVQDCLPEVVGSG